MIVGDRCADLESVFGGCNGAAYIYTSRNVCIIMRTQSGRLLCLEWDADT